ncbi:uncharacterized protein SOCE26_018050 [Sorangium cellulosum]|uniref:Uncharacterized protein n=1 Tax=Sorangium cellulosum TaxID=56 RepID=A0A2L0EM77_SORCE|nr:uncharacterized protein SOCE26_018050 [Sorangium cellulosum]
MHVDPYTTHLPGGISDVLRPAAAALTDAAPAGRTDLLRSSAPPAGRKGHTTSAASLPEGAPHAGPSCPSNTR